MKNISISSERFTMPIGTPALEQEYINSCILTEGSRRGEPFPGYLTALWSPGVFTQRPEILAPAVEEFEDAVEAGEENPTTSTRAIAEDLGTSSSTVWRVLAKHGYHPYEIALHQELQEDDHRQRLRFCYWILRRRNLDEFVNNRMFTDESNFYSDGKVNRHNIYYWAQDNPHWMGEVQTQGRWSINKGHPYLRVRSNG